MTQYPAKGMVATIPVPNDRWKTTDGYQLLIPHDEAEKFRYNGIIFRHADTDSAEVCELHRIRTLPGKVRRQLERLVAYCPSDCAMIAVYASKGQLLVHLSGTVINGAGAKIQVVQCRHQCGVPVPAIRHLLRRVPGPGRRHTVDVATLASHAAR